ncbi:MAG: nucleoside phosphorylase [Anaerolineales bacterium]
MGYTTLEPRSDNLLSCQPGDIGRYVLLPGDPGRVPKIAEYLDDAILVSRSREFTTFSGTILGEKVSVTSTGIGGPSTAIAVEELVRLGAKVLIRVGTSGLMQKYMQPGDLVITWGAVRDEYTSRQYAPLSYPAVADLGVTSALVDAAENLGLRHWVGMSQSKDSFYGQHDPKRMPVKDHLLENWQALIKTNVLCSEMEASILFVLSRMMGVRSGGIMVAGSTIQDLENLLKTSIKAVGTLIQQERERVI